MREPWFYDMQHAIEAWVADQFTIAVKVLWDDIYSIPNPLTGKVETVFPVFALDGSNENHEAMYAGNFFELLTRLARE